MSSFPTSPRSALLLWAHAHAPVWTANAVAIGLTPPQAASYAAAVTSFHDAGIAQEVAKEAYRVATENATDTFGTLRNFTGDRVRQVAPDERATGCGFGRWHRMSVPPDVARHIRCSGD